MSGPKADVIGIIPLESAIEEHKRACPAQGAITLADRAVEALARDGPMTFIMRFVPEFNTKFA